MSSPEAVVQLHQFASVSVPIFASSGHAEIAATRVVCPDQPSASRWGVICRVFPDDAKFRELVRARCGRCSAAAAWSPCSRAPAPLPVPLFGCSLPPLG